MRVMVFHKTSGEIDMTAPPTPEQLEAFAAMDRLTEEMVAAGVFVAAAGLKGGADARRILFRDGRKTVLDGPFAETKEVIAGFSIWEVGDMDEALAWAMRAPAIPGHDGELVIQPYFEAEDLAAFMTDEERAAPREGDRGRLGVA
ncbi:MAG: YciI family protein [Pseudomonadota bacterium]